MSAPHTVVTGGMRNMSVLTVVTPARSSRCQYSPYPPKVDSTINQPIATQNCAEIGGMALPVARARTVKITAEVTQWIASARSGDGRVGARRSRKVAATRHSIPVNGTR